VLECKRQKRECLKKENTTDKKSVYLVRGSVGVKTRNVAAPAAAAAAAAAAADDDDDDDEALICKQRTSSEAIAAKHVLYWRFRNMLLLNFIQQVTCYYC
jgi:hypothetical protein